MADKGNVPIPTSNDINKINSLEEIARSNIYAIDSNGNAIQPQVNSANNALLVEVTGGVTNTVDITDWGGKAQSAVDVAAKIDALWSALASQAGDELRITAPNTLATEQQSPVGVEDSSSTQIDPLARQDVSPISDSTGTAGTDITLQLGDYRKDIDFFVDVSGSATLTVEIRTAGGTWRQLDTVDYSSATTNVEQYNTAFAEIRASVDQNLNTLEASAKGV